MRFTIRDLLWLIALIAMALAWSYDHRMLRARTKESIELKICDSLVGIHRDDIVAFLGSPEMRVVGDKWFYWAGSGREPEPIWLELQFNNDRVTKSRLRTIKKPVTKN